MHDTPRAGMPRHRYAIPMYIGAGGIATASHYATTVALVEIGRIAPLFATAVGFLVGALVKYWLSYFLTFQSDRSHTAAVPRFLIVLAGQFALNAAFFQILYEWVGLHYMVAQVLTTILLIPPGYLMNRLWVFQDAQR